MSKAESIEETLGWLKIVFAAFVAVDVSLIAGWRRNFRTAEAVTLLLALFAVAGTTAGIVAVNHAAFRRLAQLEDV